MVPRHGHWTGGWRGGSAPSWSARQARRPGLAREESKARDPLKPTKALEEPWSRLYVDHWGPTQDGHHILVIVDGLTRYPEVAVVRGTSAEDIIHAFAEVFSRHGVTRKLHSDNGAPFNGKDSHLLQQYLRNMGIQHVTNKCTEDHTYEQVVEKTMQTLLKLDSKERAIIDLMRMELGSLGFMDFLADMEDQMHLCHSWETLTGKDMKRISLLGGLKDGTLA